MKPSFRPILSAAAVMGVLSVVAAGLVTLLHRHTQSRIEASEQAVLQRTLGGLVAAEDYDNDIFSDRLAVVAPELGTDQPMSVYRARKLGNVVAVILSTIAPDGHNGPIRLLVAVHPDGTVAGVRVIGHQETPGLGDAIDLEKSEWILGFSGRSLRDPPEARWAVKKEGGEFDQFTGATVTARAVVQAVRRTLAFFEQHRAELVAPPVP